MIASCFPALLIQQKNLTIRVLGDFVGEGAARWSDMAAAFAVLIFMLLGLKFAQMTLDFYSGGAPPRYRDPDGAVRMILLRCCCFAPHPATRCAHGIAVYPLQTGDGDGRPVATLLPVLICTGAGGHRRRWWCHRHRRLIGPDRTGVLAIGLRSAGIEVWPSLPCFWHGNFAHAGAVRQCLGWQMIFRPSKAD